MEDETDTQGKLVRFGIAIVVLAALAGVVRVAHSEPQQQAAADLPVVVTEPAAAPAPAPVEPDVRSSLPTYPLRFEANQGQIHTQVSFLAHGQGYVLFLTPTESVMGLHGETPTALRIGFKGSNPAPEISGEGPLAGYSNYLSGNIPTQWHRDIPTYAKVRYRNLYPGIDLIYNGTSGQLGYELVVGPDADPEVIALSVEGAKWVTLDANGDLLLQTPAGLVRHHKPTVYRKTRGEIREVAASYMLKNEREVGIRLASEVVEQPTISGQQLNIATGNAGLVYVKPTPRAIAGTGAVGP